MHPYSTGIYFSGQRLDLECMKRFGGKELGDGIHQYPVSPDEGAFRQISASLLTGGYVWSLLVPVLVSSQGLQY